MNDIFQEKLLQILGIIAQELHESNRLKREELKIANRTLTEFKDEQFKISEDLASIGR